MEELLATKEMEEGNNDRLTKKTQLVLDEELLVAEGTQEGNDTKPTLELKE